jgi:hypothetical protein
MCSTRPWRISPRIERARLERKRFSSERRDSPAARETSVTEMGPCLRSRINRSARGFEQ